MCVKNHGVSKTTGVFWGSNPLYNSRVAFDRTDFFGASGFELNCRSIAFFIGKGVLDTCETVPNKKIISMPICKISS